MVGKLFERQARYAGCLRMQSDEQGDRKTTHRSANSAHHHTDYATNVELGPLNAVPEAGSACGAAAQGYMLNSHQRGRVAVTGGRSEGEGFMAAIKFTLNGKPQTVDVVSQMPLLWVLRDNLGMTGTKFGCGMALCGACTVHLNGEAIRSCITPISSVAG